LIREDNPEAVSELRWPTAFVRSDSLTGIDKIMLSRVKVFLSAIREWAGSRFKTRTTTNRCTRPKTPIHRRQWLIPALSRSFCF